MRALAGEVAVNLQAIDRFLAGDYGISGDHIIYDGFRRINDKAEALKAVFRPWRAQHYLEAINDFARDLLETAAK